MFKTYGDAGNHWTGADNTASVPLPDGRVAWLFSDTFLGTVNADGSRPQGTPMVNNTIVVQDGTSLVATRHGGTATLPESLVKPTQQGEYFWAADGTVEGSTLKVLYNRYQKSGTGNLDFTLTGNALATFALPALTLTSVTDLPLGSTIGWGSAILEDAGYTYVYGTSTNADNLKLGYVARVPAGGLGGSWQFWTGSTWSATASAAAPLLSGVGTGFGVQKIGTQYVLLTHENNLVFDPQYVAYTAASPTGPFTGPAQLFTAPEQEPGSPVISYDARLHPELARSGKLLVSYNVNSLNDSDNYSDARLYRPRFVEVAWPPATPNPATLPAAPTGVSATLDPSGVATLSWQPVNGVTRYRVHRRDVTGGQTHFARLPTAVTGTSAEVGQLINGHRYELKVTAENDAGEGPFSALTTLTPQISAPAAPTGVTATADTAGRVTLRWTAVGGIWNYEVHRRDVTAAESDFTLASRLGGDQASYDVTGLTHGHEYEFAVLASHGGGISPMSAKVRATATYTVPAAPTGLTATAKTDGAIALSWTAPGPNVLFWVEHRDVTAGDTEFTRLELPTESTAMTDGFLLHGHQYEYRVFASNQAGESAASAVARATSAYPRPAAPGTLIATPTAGQAVLNWSASATPNAWYQVYQRDVTAGEAAFTALPLPITECCTVTAAFLTNEHTYEFRVTTTTQGGESVPTNTVSVTPRLPLPGQVTGLTAAAQTDGTIKLAWTAPGENLWFDVYQRDVTAGQASFTKLPLPVTTCCAFTASALTHNHAYEFKIAATNATGAGPQSAVAGATARYNLPAAPKNLRGEAIGNATIHLDWDTPSSGSFLYWVYYRNVSKGESFEKAQFPTDKTEIDLQFLVANDTYEYKVTADNQAGEGPATGTVQVIARGGVPAAPTGLTASAGDGEVQLSWTESSTSGVKYDVYQRDVTDGQSWRKLPLPITGTSMTAGVLANGHTYEFKVTAVNFAGASAASNVVSKRPMPPTPAAPGGLSASAGNGQVALSWNTSSTSNVSYWIEMRPAGGTWDRLPYAVGCCSFTVKVLRNGTNYEFRVRATNISGDSSPSGTASARPLPPFPGPASNLTATAGDGKAVLKWSASATVDVAYYVEMRSKGGSWQRLPYAVGCCTYTVGLLTNGTTYEFRIRTVNLAGVADPTNTANAKPMPPMPKAPTNLRGTAGNHTVRLDWTASTTPNVIYWVWQRDGQGPWVRLGWPTTRTYADLSVMQANTSYSFFVEANNLAGDSPHSNTVTVTPWAPTFEWAKYSPRRQFLWERTSPWLWMRTTNDCGGLPGDPEECAQRMQFRSTGGEYFWRVDANGVRRQSFLAVSNYYRVKKCFVPPITGIEVCSKEPAFEWNSSPACQGGTPVYGLIIMCDPNFGIRMMMNAPPPSISNPI